MNFEGVRRCIDTDNGSHNGETLPWTLFLPENFVRNHGTVVFCVQGSMDGLAAIKNDHHGWTCYYGLVI